MYLFVFQQPMLLYPGITQLLQSLLLQRHPALQQPALQVSLCFLSSLLYTKKFFEVQLLFNYCPLYVIV